MTAFILSAALGLSSAQAKPDEFAKQVATARDKAIDFLKKARKDDKTWEGLAINLLADMNGGMTAFAALAMLEAGVAANDPVIADAVEYLAEIEPKKTYVFSLQTQVLCRVDAKKHKKLIQRNVDWLLNNMVAPGGKLEGWSYPANAFADGSNTHFAVVALRDAALAGAKVDEKLWGRVRDMYAGSRTDTGWSYYERGNRVSTRTMTAAALAGLVMAAEFDAAGKGPGPAFDKGMAAFLKGSQAAGTSTSYEWFVTAELGRAMGSNVFKAGGMEKAWYREGALMLIKDQKADGSWVGQRGLDNVLPVYTTACGIYFIGPPPKLLDGRSISPQRTQRTQR